MSLFITAFITIFVIVDPLGNAAVFAGLTAKNPQKKNFKIALNATLIAIFVLLFFGFAGKFVLFHMGISSEAFKIAGGLLLFYTAFNMVMGGHQQSNPADDQKNTPQNIAIFPMAIPLMAGPGCATAFMLLLNQAKAEDLSTLYIIFAMLAVQAITFAALVCATHVKKLLGEGALSIVARIMGIFLAALSVQFILDGLNMGA